MINESSRSTDWMPTSGFAFMPCAVVNSISDAQSSVGIDKKPEDNSMTSNLAANELPVPPRKRFKPTLYFYML